MGSPEDATAVLDGCSNILVYTGAGISTESGIPDFRGPDGLWTKVDPDDFTIDRYLSSSQRRVEGWRMHAAGELWGARSQVTPNAAHHSVTELWHAGLVSGVITQNVDGLHLEAGISTDALSEIHGNVRMAVCVQCRNRQPIEQVLTRVDAGEADPCCLKCNGLLKSSTVMFGEMLPEDQIRKATAFADRADAVLVIGSTMSVYPAVDFPLSVARRGAPMVILNQGPTNHDRMAAVVVEGRAGETVPALVRSLLAR